MISKHASPLYEPRVIERRAAPKCSAAHPTYCISQHLPRPRWSRNKAEDREAETLGAARPRSQRIGVELDEVDTERPVSTYDVDSLMAVELRNWIRNDFVVEVLVFEILVGGIVSRVGEILATKVEETRKETERREEWVAEETNSVEDGSL